MAAPHDLPPTDSDGRYLFTHNLDGTEELGTTVTRAVTQAADVSPDMVGRELSKTIDYDGLDQLFRPPTNERLCPGGHLMLEVADCLVTISSDGTITVEP